MPPPLQFLYRETNQFPDAGSPINFDKAREEFSVSWVVHRYETLTMSNALTATVLDKLRMTSRNQRRYGNRTTTIKMKPATYRR
jgi:hypothetical protein